MRHERTRIAYPFRHLLVSCLLAGIAMIMSQGAHAQGTAFYPIEGGGGATVNCQTGQGLQLTGKRWQSFPSTVTGCILANNGTYGLSPQPYNVGCKGGRPIAFYPDGYKLKTCTLSNDTSYLVNTAGARPACKADSVAEFRNDGLLISCAGGVATTGDNKPPQQPGGGTTTGGQPLTPSGPYTTIVTQGETAILAGAGQYTKIGASSNRPGGRGGYLYLGDGRASATYTVQAPAAGKYALWIRFDDDGKHAPGARAVEISVNGSLALRWNNESRDTKGWVNISVGTVDLRAGANTVVFTKAATTSAAFVLDEFVLSSQPGYVPR